MNDTTRDMGEDLEQSKQKQMTSKKGRNILAVIAIDDYPNPQDKLKSCKYDVLQFAATMETAYGFEFDAENHAYLDAKATRSGIFELFERLKKLKPEDNLIIYYAGHGWFDASEDEGFWVPHDGAISNQDRCISNGTIKRKLNAIDAKHIFFISDSCYSGAMFLKADGKRSSEQSSYLEEHPSRWGLVSGRIKKVDDGLENKHSPFAEALMRHIVGHGDQMLPISILCTLVMGEVGAKTDGNQSPIGEPLRLRAHQSGQMVLYPINAAEKAIEVAYQNSKTTAEFEDFIGQYPQHPLATDARKRIAALKQAAKVREQTMWTAAKEADTLEAYDAYLDAFETPRHEVEAVAAMRRIEEDDDWAMAQKTPHSTVGYRTYISLWRHKGGRYLVEAKAALGRIKTKTIPDRLTNHPLIGTMIKVEGGTFTMGTVGNRGDEYPHSVTLDTFYMAATQVTQKQWRDIMGSDPSKLAFPGCDNCPVEGVNHDAIQGFLTKLNAKYPGSNYRLPTEAEWEYAARGGKKSKGYLYAGSDNLDEVAWYGGNSNNKTHPVAQKQANELGLFDMSGNVWEWCADWYGSDYYKNSPPNNPKGSTSGSYRVNRGGSWYTSAPYCRVAIRNNYSPVLRFNLLGFRVAL